MDSCEDESSQPHAHAPCYCLDSIDDELQKQHVRQQILSQIRQHRQCTQTAVNESLNMVLIGPLLDASSCAEYQHYRTICELYMHLYRSHKLHRNERISLLSYEDQLIALQLCLADRSKQLSGDYCIEVSHVVETYNSLIQHQLHLINGALDNYELPNLRSTLQDYTEFNKHCNYVDRMSVFESVQKMAATNEELRKATENTVYVLLYMPSDRVECAMLEHLLRSRTLYRCHVEADLNESIVSAVQFSSCSLKSVMSNSRSSPSQSVRASGVVSLQRTRRALSATEIYIQKIMISYIELLVNSRSEIALARTLNMPDRDLDHKAFTALKRYAKDKQMPMFQTAISHITRLRLGGKTYAPTSDCPIAEHVKGISEFTDLMSKLQTIIEEDPSTSSACRRVINVLRGTLVRSNSALRLSSIDNVAQMLQDKVACALQRLELAALFSPQKPAGCGGSMLGRQTTTVLRFLVDQSASDFTTASHVGILGDMFSSQKTPIRFPSIFSQFKSPDDEFDDIDSPDCKLNQTLAERLSGTFPGLTPKVKRKPLANNSNFDWAVSAQWQQDDVCADNNAVIVIPCKTIVHPGRATTLGLTLATNPLAKLLQSPAQDKENLCSEQNLTKNLPFKQSKKVVTKRVAKQTTVSLEQKDGDEGKAKNSKRPAEDKTLQQVAKKSRTKAEKNTCRRRLIPQIKGQQSIMKFIRL